MSGLPAQPVDSGFRRAVIVAGGVGPMAGVLLHQGIIRAAPTAARGDADHLDVWHLSVVADMPDRTRFLLGSDTRNPGPVMADNVAAVAQVLAGRGQDWVVAVPCATFHAPSIYGPFHARIERLPGFFGVVHLVEATIAHLRSLPGRPARIGVISTQGSWQTGVWSHPLGAAGLEVLEPGPDEAARAHAAIYDPGFGLKAKQPPSQRAEAAILEVAQGLLERGAQVLVLGCTELAFVTGRIVECLGDRLLVCDPLAVQAMRVDAVCRESAARPKEIE